jgi:hypothetical protein
MEALSPKFREMLKESNPGLTDEHIDRVEELLAQRFLLDPQKQPQQLRALDREREQLQERIPNFQDLWVQYREREEAREREEGP